MKKYLFIFCLLVVAACSDDDSNTLVKDPFLPVSDLDIPKREFVDAEISVKGRGFSPDCEIWLQINGGNTVQAEVLRVDETGVAFKVTVLEPGFYAVILKQEGKEYRIGGINLMVRELAPGDIEAYGVLGENMPEVCPVSISKRIIGQSLFKTREGYTWGGALVSPDKKIYYSGYSPDYIYLPGKPAQLILKYYIGIYDLVTKENKEIEWANGTEYFAIGFIDGALHVLVTSDNNIFRLIKLSDSGEETEVKRFDLTRNGGKRVLVHNGLFTLDATGKNILVTAKSLAGSSLEQYAWAFNLATGDVAQNGGNNAVSYHMVGCAGTYYCFASEGTDEFNTHVLSLPNPQEWSYGDASLKVAFLTGTDFRLPVYSASAKLIYGLGDGETVLVFNPATNGIVSKWVKSGILYLFTIE